MGRQVLTDDEREAKAITKSRWMTLRDSLSSTQAHGFRIDALRTPLGHLTAFECRSNGNKINKAGRALAQRLGGCYGFVT